MSKRKPTDAPDNSSSEAPPSESPDASSATEKEEEEKARANKCCAPEKSSEGDKAEASTDKAKESAGELESDDDNDDSLLRSALTDEDEEQEGGESDKEEEEEEENEEEDEEQGEAAEPNLVVSIRCPRVLPQMGFKPMIPMSQPAGQQQQQQQQPRQEQAQLGRLLFTAVRSSVIVPKAVDCECTELVGVYRRMLVGSRREPGEVEGVTKCGTRTLGFKLPHVREVFGAFASARLAGFARDRKVVMALGLLQQELVEEKMSGVLLLAKCARQLNVRCLRELAKVVHEYVHDLGVCDALGLKVLFLCIKTNTQRGKLVRVWKDAPSVWLQRCCCMAHLKAAKDERHTAAALEVCEACVASPTRALQVAVGWLLREAAAVAPDTVAAFVRGHLAPMSRECLKYATECLDPAVRTALIHAFRRAHNLMGTPSRRPAAAPRYDAPVPTPPAPVHIVNPFIRRRLRVVRGSYAGFSPNIPEAKRAHNAPAPDAESDSASDKTAPVAETSPTAAPAPSSPAAATADPAKDDDAPRKNNATTPSTHRPCLPVQFTPYQIVMMPRPCATPVVGQQQQQQRPTQPMMMMMVPQHQMMAVQQNWLQQRGNLVYVVQPGGVTHPAAVGQPLLWHNAPGSVK